MEFRGPKALVNLHGSRLSEMSERAALHHAMHQLANDQSSHERSPFLRTARREPHAARILAAAHSHPAACRRAKVSRGRAGPNVREQKGPPDVNGLNPRVACTRRADCGL